MVAGLTLNFVRDLGDIYASMIRQSATVELRKLFLLQNDGAGSLVGASSAVATKYEFCNVPDHLKPKNTGKLTAVL